MKKFLAVLASFIFLQPIIAQTPANQTHKEKEVNIKWTRHLPQPVRTAWEKSSYAGWYVHKIKKIETPGQQSYYVLHVNNTPLLDANKVDNFREDQVLYFSPEGELIRKDRIS